MRKTNIFEISDDVAAISCVIEHANLKIESATQNKLTVEYPDGVGIQVEPVGDRLIIAQKLSGLARLLKLAAQPLTIKVPTHIVPSVTVTGDNAKVYIESGIYGAFEYKSKRGGVKVENAMLASAELKGESVNITIANSTIRGSLICSEANGNVNLENIFASHIDCRVKSGDVGAANLNCRDSAFEANRGNVTATVLGDERVFGISLTAKDGTCNRESANKEREEATFKAYSAKGNIFVDFIFPDKEAAL